ncbi:MAG: AsmA-like C-terminal region-containing protein [Nitrospinota bacterium]|nr:AsmA-like C-terminal region-containing protein [Nitrospinota bacterium]
MKKFSRTFLPYVVAVLLGGIALFAWEKSSELATGELQSKLEAVLQEKFGAQYELREFKFSFFPQLEFTVRDAVLVSGDIKVSTERVSVHIPLVSIILGRAIISDVQLFRPKVKIIRNRDGHWNFPPIAIIGVGAGKDDLSDGPGNVALKRISIIDGEISFTDESIIGQPERILKITTANYNAAGVLAPATINMSGVLIADGKSSKTSVSFSWIEGEDKVSFKDLEVQGDIRISSLTSDLVKPYMEGFFPEWLDEKFLSVELSFSGNIEQHFDFFGRFALNPEQVAFENLKEETLSPDSKWIEVKGNLKGERLSMSRFKLHLPEIDFQGNMEIENIWQKDPVVRLGIGSSLAEVPRLIALLPQELYPKFLETFSLESIEGGSIRLIDFNFSGKYSDAFKAPEKGEKGAYTGRLEVRDLAVKPVMAKHSISEMNGILAVEPKDIIFKKISARYGASQLKNVSGVIEDFWDNPVFLAKFVADLNLKEFHEELIDNIGSKQLYDILKPIHKFSGNIGFEFLLQYDIAGGKLMEFFGNFDFRNIGFTHELFENPVEDLNGTVFINQELIEITELELVTGTSIFRTTGTVYNYLKEDYLFELTLDASGDTAEFASTVFYTYPYLNSLKGYFGSKLEVEGTLDDMTFRQWSDFTEAEYRFQDKFFKPVGVLSQAMANGRIVGMERVIIDKVDIKLGESQLLLSGYVDNFLQIRNFKFDLSVISLNLDDTQHFLKMFKPGEIKGKIKGNLSLSETDGESTYDYDFQLDVKKIRLNRLEKLGGLFEKLKLKGNVSGLVYLKGASGKNPSMTGEITGKGIGFKTVLARPIFGLTGKILLSGDRISIQDVRAGMGRSKGMVSLDMDVSTTPHIILTIDGDEIYLEDIVKHASETDGETDIADSPEPPGEERKKFIDPSWEIHVKSKKGTINTITYNDLEASLAIADDQFEFSKLKFGGYAGEWDIAGNLDIRDGNQLFSVKLKVDNVDMKPFFHDVIPDVNRIGGHMDLRGEVSGNGLSWDMFRKNLSGRMDIEMRDGMVEKFGGVSQVFAYINVLPLFKKRHVDMVGKGLPFNTVKGTFSLKDGVGNTENLTMEGDVLRLSMLGDVNLAEGKLDLLLGLKPFTTIDKVVSSIPLAGKILAGDEKSLIISYYRLGGTFDNPDSRAVPAESVARTMIGIVQRILEAPAKALSTTGNSQNE